MAPNSFGVTDNIWRKCRTVWRAKSTIGVCFLPNRP